MCQSISSLLKNDAPTIWKGLGYMFAANTLLTSYDLINATIEVRDPKTREMKLEPMLIGDKLAVLCISTLFLPVKIPVKIVENMNRAHLYFQGRDPIEYGYEPKKNIHEYIMH